MQRPQRGRTVLATSIWLKPFTMFKSCHSRNAMATQIHLIVDYSPTRQLYITPCILLIFSSLQTPIHFQVLYITPCILLIFSSLQTPIHFQVLYNPSSLYKKTLLGLITSAKRPWRVYARFGYAIFVANSARGIIYNPLYP